MLGLLRRNLSVGSHILRQQAYQSLVRPTLEYSSPVWDPPNENNIFKLERIQRRAARYVCQRFHNTSSVTSMIDQLGWDSLKKQREHAKVTCMYKITHGLVSLNPEKYMVKRHNRHSRNFNSHSYRQISTTKTFHQSSFFPSTIVLWNRLPEEAVTAPNLENFKMLISRPAGAAN